MSDVPGFPFRLALIGAGRVGTAVAELLRRRGHDVVGVASRSTESAERSADLLGTKTFRLDPAHLPDADVVLLASPDEALPRLGAEFGAVARAGSVLWHVSGASGLEPLRAAIERGVHGCAVHPLQACPTIEAALENLPGCAWGVTVTPVLRDWARRLVDDDLQGIRVEIAEEHRPMWHATSITTSTGINAVLALGETLLDAIGVDRPDDVLRPLVFGTLRHSFESGGGRRTITGPVVRAEEDALQRHLGAVRRFADQGVLRDYVAVARLVFERAVAAGLLTGADAERMRALLEEAARAD